MCSVSLLEQRSLLSPFSLIAPTHRILLSCCLPLLPWVLSLQLSYWCALSACWSSARVFSWSSLAEASRGSPDSSNSPTLRCCTLGTACVTAAAFLLSCLFVSCHLLGCYHISSPQRPPFSSAQLLPSRLLRPPSLLPSQQLSYQLLPSQP